VSNAAKSRAIQNYSKWKKVVRTKNEKAVEIKYKPVRYRNWRVRFSRRLKSVAKRLTFQDNLTVGLPNTKKSKTVTVRFPVAELREIEALGRNFELNRHALLRLSITEALRSGLMAKLAEQRANQKVEAPA
jgi:hypothetical protein